MVIEYLKFTFEGLYFTLSVKIDLVQSRVGKHERFM
jgi:hypothetical protein